MPTLQFKGKPFVWNHHLSVPFHGLIPKKDKGLSKKVSLDDNLIIHGDNLAALKSLLPTHAGKVKCVYIDPPYNTGNEGWAYNDNVNSPMMKEWLGKIVDRDDLTRHDKWLCMMTPRLKLLRDLLRDDGMIFISIDDNEFNNLIALCDDIFGEENRFGILIIKNNPRGRRLGTELAVEHEYLVAYARKLDEFNAGKVELTEEQMAEYSGVSGEGKRFRLLGLRKRGALSRREDRKNLFFPIYIDPRDGTVGVEYVKGLKEVVPKLSDGSDGVWRWGKDKVKKDSRFLVAKQVRRKDSGLVEYDVFQIDYIENEEGEMVTRLFPSIWEGSKYNNETGRDQLKELFGSSPFEYPKPVGLITDILVLANDKDAIVLDSFAGSGTAAHAVLKLNNKDGGNRKFILVEMENYADKITAERVRRVIKGVKKSKDEDLKKGLDGTFSYFELGKAIDADAMLTGKHLPTYEDLARYVFFTATGEEFVAKKVNKKTWKIGETKDFDVFLFYEPEVEKLKKMSFGLDEAVALKGRKGKRKLVFAPAKYLDQNGLDKYGIVFQQLPYEIYRVGK